MKKFLFVCVLALLALPAAADVLSADKFLDILRDNSSRNGSTYGILEGNAVHVRREKGRRRTEEYPCFMALIITPGKTITQIIVNNDEAYLVGRTLNKSTSLRKTGGDTNIMERIGLSPGDLAMSFLDGQLIRELPSANVRMVNCRILLLKSKNTSEWIKVYAAEDYFFVLKAEFFNVEPGEKTEPLRTLEINSFGQKNKLYYPRSIEMYGPGWRTDISFDKADMDLYDPEKGTVIFRSLK